MKLWIRTAWESSGCTRGGLLVTTSREWVSGSSEQVCATSYGLATDVSMSIRLQQTDESTTRRQRRPQPRAVYSHTTLVLPAGLSSCRNWLIHSMLGFITHAVPVVVRHVCERRVATFRLLYLLSLHIASHKSRIWRPWKHRGRHRNFPCTLPSKPVMAKKRNFGNGRLNLHCAKCSRVQTRHHPDSEPAPLKDTKSTKKLWERQNHVHQQNSFSQLNYSSSDAIKI